MRGQSEKIESRGLGTRDKGRVLTTPNPKNHLSLMPSVHHMIPAVRYFQSGLLGHPPPSNQLAVRSNVKMRPFMLYPGSKILDKLAAAHRGELRRLSPGLLFLLENIISDGAAKRDLRK
jgi:hypothetical protein